MATELVDASKLDACCTAEANAIRAKTGSSAQIAYDWANSKGFADAIAAISGGSGLGYDEKTVLVKTNTPTVDRAFTNFIFIAQVDIDEIPSTYPGNLTAWFLTFMYIDGNYIPKTGGKGQVVSTGGASNPYASALSNLNSTSVGATSITFSSYSSQGMYRSSDGIKWNVKQIELPDSLDLYSFADFPDY